MEKIKLRSNPYLQIISYYKWNDSVKEWEEITSENSALLKDKMKKGFLPFIAQDIIDVILEEYSTIGDKIEILFEGTDDEFKEIESVCLQDEYIDRIKLVQSDHYLENARDIFPDIIRIFERIKPLISEEIQEDPEVKRNLEKFSDVSKDLIPICVLGNYSTGKSTFINALIGWELLANSDEPVTAKVYSITKSQFPDRAKVQFKVAESSVSIRFEDKYSYVLSDCDDDLIKLIEELLEKNKADTMLEQVSKLLRFLNNVNREQLSDLIEIEVPFNQGLWNTSNYQFVIFDTPGSNSASNEKHLRVLKDAMKNLSNGLPVFVSEYTALDSLDNENLHKELKKMDGLDSRFTLIVVNKADKAALPKSGFSSDAIDHILAETLPRNLYSEGIFFVSSILGLGNKIKGEFYDENYAEIYETEKTKYLDPSSKFYKKLYTYNIMPKQIKEISVKSAEECDNKIFANSGLYSIEEEIQKFAQKYSPYNKCQQSQLFLGNVIEKTNDILESNVADMEFAKNNMYKNMEKEKMELLNNIEIKGNSLEKDYYDAYYESIGPTKERLNKEFFQDSLEDEHEELKKKQEELQQLSEVKNEFTNAKEIRNSTLSSNFKELIHARSLKAIKSAFSNTANDFVDGTKVMLEKSRGVADTKKEIEIKTADDLIDLLNSDYYTYSTKSKETIEEESIEYWNNKVSSFKSNIIDVITGSAALEQEKKDEIEGVIMSFESISFSGEEIVFVKDKFTAGFKIGNMVFGDSNKLNLDKLKRDYNYEMYQAVDNVYNQIKSSHYDSFKNWKSRLMNQIFENIVSYSPDLSKMNRTIQMHEKKIRELESKRRRLVQHNNDIKKMMEWKDE